MRKEILKTKPQNLDEFILGYCARETMKQPQPTITDYLNDLSVGKRKSGMSVIRGQDKLSKSPEKMSDVDKVSADQDK